MAKYAATCAYCGKRFAAARNTARYCSARCRKAAERARTRLVPDFAAGMPPDVGPAVAGAAVRLPTGRELAQAALSARAAARAFEAGALAGDPWSPACARIAAAIHGALEAEGL